MILTKQLLPEHWVICTDRQAAGTENRKNPLASFLRIHVHHVKLQIYCNYLIVVAKQCLMMRHDVKLHFTNITQPKVHIFLRGNEREGGLIIHMRGYVGMITGPDSYEHSLFPLSNSHQSWYTTFQYMKKVSTILYCICYVHKLKDFTAWSVAEYCRPLQL